MRGATRGCRRNGGKTSFQSTHPVRGATPAGPRLSHVTDLISIHAPRAGCDAYGGVQQTPPCNFNPRTPCGVRLALPRTQYCRPQFQSTHPVRGATTTRGFRRAVARFQSTHPVRGATLKITRAHRPQRFQSTHPVRGATIVRRPGNTTRKNFNPRTPCGVRRPSAKRKWLRLYFNPRTPCGVRHGRSHRYPSRCNFNPRTPCGVRPSGSRSGSYSSTISIHAPRAGCDIHRSPSVLSSW